MDRMDSYINYLTTCRVGSIYNDDDDDDDYVCCKHNMQMENLVRVNALICIQYRLTGLA